MMEIASNPAFQGSHEFKFSAMAKTIAFPMDPWFHLGDPRLIVGLLFLNLSLVVQLVARRQDGVPRREPVVRPEGARG